MLPLIVLFALGAAAVAAARRSSSSQEPAQPPAAGPGTGPGPVPAWRRARDAGPSSASSTSSASSAPPRAPSSSPVLHPRTERPWCEMRPQDLEAEDLSDRAGLERWARCSTRTEDEIEIMAARFDRAFSDAATDGEALALAQNRDAMRRAFQARGAAR